MSSTAALDNLHFQAHLLSRLGDAVVAVDQQRRVIFWNAAAERLYHLPAAEVLGRPLREAYLNEWIRPEDEQAALESLAWTGAWHGENIHVLRDGTRITTEATVTVFPLQEGGETGLVAVIRDITSRRAAEDSLRFQAQLLEVVGRAVIATDMAGTITYWNHTAVELYGWERQEVLGRNVADILGSSPALEHPTEVISELRHGGHWTREVHMRRRDGSVFPALVTDAPIYNQEGDYTGISRVAIDLTERRQAEQALEQKEERFRTSVENFIDGFAIFSAIRDAAGRIADFRFEYINEAGCRINRRTREEQVGHSVLEVLPFYREAGLFDAFVQVVETGQPFVQELVIYDHPTGPGRRIAQAYDIRASKMGDGLVASWRDISRRKQMEEQIQRNGARAQVLAELSQALAEASLAYEDLLDLVARRVAELVGDACLVSLLAEDPAWLQPVAFYHPDPAGRAFLHKLLPGPPYRADQGAGGQVVATGQPLLVPQISPDQVRDALPPAFWPYLERFGMYSILLVALRVEGRTIGTLGISRDQPGRPYTAEDQSFLQELADRAALAISNARHYAAAERARLALEKRTVQLEAANKDLESFSYSVSHDLRAPLRSIDGFSQVLLEDYAGQLDDQGKAYLQRVRANAQRMAELIDDLLGLSRVIRADMHLEPVNLSVLAQFIAAGLQSRDPARQVEFAIAPDLTAQADLRLVRVVLENLLSNAWKFTSRETLGHIEFGVIEGDGAPAYFVRDNGAGFDMAYAGKLFGAFQRLHSAAEFPGTGIGLATVQRIIHRHGGRVWAEGDVDQGATFYFTL